MSTSLYRRQTSFWMPTTRLIHTKHLANRYFAHSLTLSHPISSDISRPFTPPLRKSFPVIALFYFPLTALVVSTIPPPVFLSFPLQSRLGVPASIAALFPPHVVRPSHPPVFSPSTVFLPFRLLSRAIRSPSQDSSSSMLRYFFFTYFLQRRLSS